MPIHERKGKFVKVGENLYRYSTSKIYYAVFRRNGKLRWVSLKTDDRELANRKLNTEITNVGKVDARHDHFTVEQLLEMYEQQIKRFDVGTQLIRCSVLNAFRRTWRYGLDTPVKDVTPAQLDVWLAGHKERMKRTSINLYILVVRQMFNLATAHRVIAESPAANLKMLKPETPIRQTPTWEQFQEIVKSIRTRPFTDHAQDTADLVEFMGLAGVGTAECANLLGEHFHFDTNKITLYRSKTDTGYTIPIFPQLKSFLERLREKGRIQNGQKVFKIENPKKALEVACKRLKLPHFSSRALRRCFITRAIELGIDFKTIAAWQGHRDGGVLIAKTYSHLRSEHSDAMAKKLVAA